MKLIDLTCTRCGATLKVNSELTKCMCQYCGNEMLIDQEVQKHEFTNGYEFGYQAELGRQKAIQDRYNKDVLEAGKIIIKQGKATIGIIQRELNISFNKASKIMNTLGDLGVIEKEIGGVESHKILMTMEQYECKLIEYR